MEEFYIMSIQINKFLVKHIWFWPLLIGLVLRLYKITASSIWHDEGYTMWILRFNPAEIIARNIRDVHPPGYYLIAKPWVTIFGNSVFSIRFLSLIFSIGIIYLVFLTVKRLFNVRAAFWASLFVALSPFMIRFGQEARMYGVVAFFTTLATYFLVKFIQEKKSITLLWYALSMILAVYSQYYGFFVVISHWIIIAIATPDFFKFKWGKTFKEKYLIWNPWWWVANISILIAYLPWFPKAYKQVTRISGDYWIKPEWITERTIPNNIIHFITYTHMDAVFFWNKFFGPLFFWLIIGLLVFSPFWLFYKYKDKEQKAKLFSVIIFGFLPMLLVFTISKLKTPVYQDRYFPFSAVGLFALWGIFVSEISNKKVKYLVCGLAISALLVGNVYMHIDVNHQMKKMTDVVKSQSLPGDKYVSGELYTFLDSSYYMGYGNIKFLSKPVDGFGESSLFYKEQDEYLINPDQIENYGNRIWVIGKTGDKEYFSDEFWDGWSSSTYFEENKNNGLRATLYFK